MDIYLWIIVFVTFYGFSTYWIPDRQISKKIYIIISSIHLIVIQGLRHVSVGGDLYRYETNYILSENLPLEVFLEGRFENGYQIINLLFSSIGLSFQGFIFLISIFVFVIVGIFIYRYSESPLISYLLYIILGIFDFGFSGIRQIIAMSIILLSFNSIIDKKWEKFFIITIFASFFHSSALIFLVVYPIANWSIISKLYNLLYFPLIILFLLFGNRISLIATTIFDENLLSYLTTNSQFSTTAIIIFIVFVIGLFTKYYFKDLNESELFNTLLTIVSLSLLLQILSSYSYLFTRINLYFFQFIVIFIPSIYKRWRVQLTGQSKHGILLLNMTFYVSFFIFSLLFFQQTLSNNPHMIVPHMFFWE